MPLRRIFLAVVVAAALALTGCGGSGDDETVSESTMTVETAEVSITTVAEFEAWVHDVHGGSAWLASLSRVAFATKLGSPVIELHFRGAGEATGVLAEQALGAIRATDPGLQAWVEAWDEDGQIAGAGFGTPRERDFPESPTGIGKLRDWLAVVYGPESGEPVEPWYEAIETVKLGESAAQLPVIRVETSLPAGEKRSGDRAALIVIAVSQAAPSFAQGIEVWYADEMGMLSGSTDTYDPYVY